MLFLHGLTVLAVQCPTRLGHGPLKVKLAFAVACTSIREPRAVLSFGTGETERRGCFQTQLSMFGKSAEDSPSPSCDSCGFHHCLGEVCWMPGWKPASVPHAELHELLWMYYFPSPFPHLENSAAQEIGGTLEQEGIHGRHLQR